MKISKVVIERFKPIHPALSAYFSATIINTAGASSTANSNSEETAVSAARMNAEWCWGPIELPPQSEWERRDLNAP